MHELSVTESLLEITLRHAANEGAKRVTDLNLVIGELSSIVDDSVQFYWDIVSEKTIAVGAKLHFRRVPLELLCQNCENRYTPGKGGFACPKCQSEQVSVTAGEEFYLDSIVVE
jgi:hydrogenase nickel incorporation protein HypA/HybF